MVVLQVLVSSLVFGCVFADGLTEPCDVTDLDCLGKSTETFLSHTSAGIPAYDIRPLDPLVINNLDLEGDKGNIKVNLQNVTLTGLKQQVIDDFKMNTETKSVELTTKADLQAVVAHLTIHFLSKGKVYSGSYTIKGPALGTAKYNYNFVTDDKGVEHFELGPETISCNVQQAPEVTVTDELLTLEAEQAKNEDASKKETASKLILCAIIKEAYITVVHNIRAAAKLLPKSAFFKNI